MSDICANRHRGNVESIDAFQSVLPFRTDSQARVYEYVVSQDRRGATLKEIERGLGMNKTTVSARLSELKELGMVKKRGDRREGCAVLVPVWAESEAKQ